MSLRDAIAIIRRRQPMENPDRRALAMLFLGAPRPLTLPEAAQAHHCLISRLDGRYSEHDAYFAARLIADGLASGLLVEVQTASGWPAWHLTDDAAQPGALPLHGTDPARLQSYRDWQRRREAGRALR